MSVSIQTTLGSVERPKQPLGVHHALLVFTSPRSLFSRVEDTGAYGWALVLLLGLAILIGYVEVQSGLIDRVVDQQTQDNLADLEVSQGQLIDRIELRDRMEQVNKAGEFNKTLFRLGAVAFSPIQLLASYLLIASLLYAAVALTGRKPEYHTLMSICVYAGFIELFGYLVRLSMVFYYKTIDVNTSLAMLATPGKPTILVALDPFRIWFWIMVVMGLIITKQLGRKMAIFSCTTMAVLAAGVRVAISYGSNS